MRGMVWCRMCLVIWLAFSSVGAAAQEVTARIAGLETNEEYMSLLREDARLQAREDSVMRAVTDIRRRFRDEPANRNRLSQDILSLEEQIFGIRNAKGRLTDRISTIEQEWVVSNLDAPRTGGTLPGDSSVPAIPEAEKVRNLICNPYFERELPAADYAALREAQRQEWTAVDYVNRYFFNYHDLSLLAETYAAAGTEPEAVELFARCQALQEANRALADSLARTWNAVFDNKTYAYAYLLDKLGQDEILAREEQLFSDAAQQLSEIRGQYASDEVADYFLRKRVAVDYEIRIADLLQLDAARDSLRGVAVQLRAVDYRVPPVVVEQRYFLDYAPIEFSKVSPYTYQNPIPECRVHAHGTIYRILLGTFNTKRAAAVFKGAHPLCYQIDEQHKWRYFGGGFATLAEAEEAQRQMKDKGFLRPEIVVWRDGAYRNLTRDPERVVPAFRVEISGVAALSEAVKQAIAAAASDYEISRAGGQTFIVGPFPERATAEVVAAAVRRADPALEINVAETQDIPK